MRLWFAGGQKIEKKGVEGIEMSVMAMADAGNDQVLYIARAPIGRLPSVGQPAESSTLTAPTVIRPAPAFPLEPSSSPCNRAQSTPPSDLTVRGRHDDKVSTGIAMRQECGERREQWETYGGGSVRPCEQTSSCSPRRCKGAS